MPEATEAHVRSFNELIGIATTPDNAANMLRAYYHVDLRETATQVRCPCIVFHPRQDAQISFEEGRMLAALIPGARFIPLESRNHLVLATESAWRQLTAELDAFLPSRGGASADAAVPDDLTPREREVLALVAEGLNNGAIAARLGISEKTVRNHVWIVLDKLGVTSRVQAVVRARDAGLGRGQTK